MAFKEKSFPNSCDLREPNPFAVKDKNAINPWIAGYLF